MDPTSQDNSFGSFGPGGNNPTVPVGGGVKPAAPVGDVNNPMTPASGVNNLVSPTGLNQMGMNSAMPVSFGTGDIVIGGERQKKSKKGLVIGLIVGVVVIAVLTTFTIMNFVRNTQTSNESMAFNRYLNYMLYGEESNDVVMTFIPSVDYYIDEKFEDKNYLDRIANLWDDFYSDLSEDEKRTISKTSVERIKEYINDLKVFLDIELLNEEYVLNEYIVGGKSNTLRYIRDYYVKMDEYSDGIANVLQLDSDMMSMKVDLWVVYDKFSCRVEDGFDLDCIKNIPSSETETITKKIEGYRSDVYMFQKQAVRMIKNISYDILNKLKNDFVEEEQDDEEY